MLLLFRVKGILRKYASFIGPGLMVSVAYMDPGNYATGVTAGAANKYSLLFIVFISNLIAIFLQILCIRLGSITGYDLARCCREYLPKRLNYVLWFLAECAIIATDVAEVIGSAIALNILLRIPLPAGVCITIIDILIVLLAYRNDSSSTKLVKLFEYFVAILVLAVTICFAIQLSQIHADAAEIFRGFVPSKQMFDGNGMTIATSILGATVMVHSLFLGSGIVQPRLREYDYLHNLIDFGFDESESPEPSSQLSTKRTHSSLQKRKFGFAYIRGLIRFGQSSKSLNGNLQLKRGLDYFRDLIGIANKQSTKLDTASIQPGNFESGPGLVDIGRIEEIDMNEIEMNGTYSKIKENTPIIKSQELRNKEADFFYNSYKPSYQAIQYSLKYSIIELTLTLVTFALFVNSALVIVAGATLYGTPEAVNADLYTIHDLLSSTLAPVVGTIFMLALLFSGQSAGIVCTIAGQIVSEGHINWKLKPWVRRLVTRSISIIPCLAISASIGKGGLGIALNISQVIISLLLPPLTAPLIYFTCKKDIMKVELPLDLQVNGEKYKYMQNPWWVKGLAIVIWIFITVLNVYAIYDMAKHGVSG